MTLQIGKKHPDGLRLHDVLEGCERWQVNIGRHGFVALVDVMPRLCPAGQTADHAIVQAARVSYGQGTKTVQEDVGLINYLMRNRHTTPSEMVEFKFHCAIPIFVARQWIRHRTANVNEYSGRYSEVPDRFYTPTPNSVRAQSKTNRQGGAGQVEQQDLDDFLANLARNESDAYRYYQDALESGVSREQARIGLPLSTFTEWYWKIDLHNLFHFLSLRMDSHAQEEIRVYAEAMFELIQPIVPVSCAAFLDYRLRAMTLSAREIEALKTGQPLATDNKREQQEWQAKRVRLGLDSTVAPG